ncbi:hypothetical protein GGU11DRAFT_835747 [Lentinula aff. detonsa]|nr:hypothetical protein GGU11DRAFT_835747 [Lentinula aff. detonsa]
MKRKMGSVIEHQKVDQDLVLGTTSNIDSGDHPSPSTMSISEQSTRDNEVSGSADIEKVVAIQPPPQPRSPTEPGQIRENPFVENESSPSSNGITVRSSPMANYAARKLEKATVLGTGPTVVRNNHHDEEDNPNSDEPVEVQNTSNNHGERKEITIEETVENDVGVTEENDPGVPTVDNEGFNINTSAKPSSQHV